MSGRRKVLLRLIAAAIGLAALVWTIARLGPRRVLELALEADAIWLLLSLLPVIARYLIWGYKWQRMLSRERRVPLRHAVRLLMAGVFVNLTTPTAKLGGGVLRAAALHKRYGFELSSAFGWVLADQMTNVLGSMLLFGALALAGGTIAPGYTVAGALGLLLFGGMISARGWAWHAAQKPRLARAFVRFTPARFRVVEGDRETVRWVRPLFIRSCARRPGPTSWSPRSRLPRSVRPTPSCYARSASTRRCGSWPWPWPSVTSPATAWGRGVGSG